MPDRVRTRRQFELFASPTSRGQSGPLRVFFVSRPEADSGVAVAYAIGKKVGIAVQRNRIRRRLRALVDHLDPQPLSGLYLIRCGSGTGRLTYDQLEYHLRRALERANAL